MARFEPLTFWGVSYGRLNDLRNQLVAKNALKMIGKMLKP